jgi:hypothetical protein
MISLRGIRRIVVAALVVPAIGGLGGCGLLDPEICHDGVIYRVEPAEATIAVGQSFTAVATIDSCPQGERPIGGAWTAQDPSIVQVDAQTGRVTGISEGQTRVRFGDDDDWALLTVLVTVQGSL